MNMLLYIDFNKQLYADVLRIFNCEPNWDVGLISLQLQSMETYSDIDICDLNCIVSKISGRLTEVNTGGKIYFEFEP